MTTHINLDDIKYTVILFFYDSKLNRVVIYSDDNIALPIEDVSNDSDRIAYLYEKVVRAYAKLRETLAKKYGQKDADGDNVWGELCDTRCLWLNNGVFVKLEIQPQASLGELRAKVHYFKDTRVENADLL